MKVSYNWLQTYFTDNLPTPNELAETLTMHAYEVEEVGETSGDHILDIDVLPNRAADSLSHMGVAREVATLLGRETEFTFDEPKTDSGVSTSNHVNLHIASDHVRRATKRLVADVSIAESSDGIKKRLKALGQQPINNIVDLTNYVMLETGQPVHAFDYDKIAGDKPKEIIIREANDGEAITTLDGQEYELDSGMLVIADEQKPLDIAGIKGGMNSHIDKDTKRILLSVCSFDPAIIRKTSQKLALRTDASKRFENNINPETASVAVNRLSALVEKHAGGRVATDISQRYPQQANTQYVTGVKTDTINEHLGTDLDQKQAKEILKGCHCDVDIVDPAKQVLEHAREYEGAPYERGASVRFDAPNKFDCSSYTSFLFSQFGGVSIPRMSVDQFMYGTPVDEDEMKPGDLVFYNTGERIIYHETQEFMPGTPVEDGIDHPAIYLGDGKVISATSYTGEVTVTDIDNPDFGDRIGVRRMAQGQRLRVKVPYWRQDLRQPEDLIEEVGRVHGYENITETVPEKTHDKPPVHKTFYYTQKIRDILATAGTSEVYTYAFQDDGDIRLENPIAEDKAYLRENLADGLQKALAKNQKHKALLSSDEVDIFEIGNVFRSQEEVLELGLASTGGTDSLRDFLANINKEFDIDVSNFVVGSAGSGDGRERVVRLDLDELINALPQPETYSDLSSVNTDVVYEPFSQYPYVLRDIAFWAPEKIKNKKSEVKKLLQEAAGELLVHIKLFDEYDPDDKDQVSLAYRLVFQSNDRTLEDEEVNEVMDKVYDAVKEQDWVVR